MADEPHVSQEPPFANLCFKWCEFFKKIEKENVFLD